VIDYTDLDLVDDNMFIVGDTTTVDPNEESPIVHFYDLNPLLHCLSVAGGLEKARRAGFFEGLGYERHLATLDRPIQPSAKDEAVGRG
jgi:hypothetical protein